jgi:murein DD-endopeptidase MepM/ murein hydrolase activator NlpD
MSDRRNWTILLVPPKNQPAKSFMLPGWAFRALAWTGGISLLLVSWAVVVLFTPWGTPGARLVAAENAALQADITAIEERFKVLDDTLRSIASREEQMKMLAGLPTEVSAVRDSTAGGTPDAMVASASIVDLPAAPNQATNPSATPTRRRPFLGRLGWSARPDIEGMISRASTLANGLRDVSDTLERNFQRFANTPSIMPTAGWLSSQFTSSRFHPILHENRPHEGIDVTAPTGTPIVAPAAGRVVFAGNDKGYGLVVEIDHGNGIRTRFAHCSRLAVRAGQSVTRNQLIAAVGSTGLSTAPHLHYEIHVNGKPVDPITYVLPDAPQ